MQLEGMHSAELPGGSRACGYGRSPEREEAFLSIPLPPCERMPARLVGTRVHAELMGSALRGKANDEKARRLARRDARRALVVGLIVNALIAALLLLKVSEKSSGEGSDDILVTFQETAEAEEADAGGNSKIVPQKAVPRRSSNRAMLPPVPKVPGPSMTFYSEFETQDPTRIEVQPSLSSSDLEEARLQIEERLEGQLEDIRQVLAGRGTEGQRDGFFSASGLGDGSDMVLFLDTSGSMEGISHAVGSYVRKRFPGSRAIGVENCRMQVQFDWIVHAIWQQANRSQRTKYFFVCDLQDGESDYGIRLMRDSLLRTGPRKELHVISFDKPPGPELQKLIRDCGGSFTLVDPGRGS